MAKIKKPLIIAAGLVIVVVIIGAIFGVRLFFKQHQYTLVIQNNSNTAIVVKSLTISGTLHMAGNTQIEPSAFGSLGVGELALNVTWESSRRESFLQAVIYEQGTGREKSFSRTLYDEGGRGGFFTLNYVNGTLLEPAFNYYCGY